MSTKRKLPTQIQLKLSDVKCPICFYILVKPVTMPCKHSLCMNCFDQHVAQTSLACPVCRTRISIWVRRSSKANNLVNMKLWQQIQEQFPEKLAAHIQGQDDSDTEECSPVVHQVSEPGAIRKEFEAMLAREMNETAQLRSKEEMESSRLILQLQDEQSKMLKEQEKLKMQEQQDAQLAFTVKETERKAEAKLREQLKLAPGGQSKVGAHSTSATHTQGPMDVYIGKSKTNGSLQENAFPTPSCSHTSLDPDRTHQKGPKRVPSSSLPLPKYPGRHLREITSSQSSESEQEDLSQGAQSTTASLPNVGGKENIHSRLNEKEKNESPTKNRHKSRILKHSPDVGFYSGSRVAQPHHTVDSSDEEASSDDDRDHNRAAAAQNCGSRSKRGEKGKSSGSEAAAVADVDTQELTAILCEGEANNEMLAAMVEQQQRIESMLMQEATDRLLAEALQKQLNQQNSQVNRMKGSEDEYSLRKRKLPASSKGRHGQRDEWQPTLHESLSKYRRK